MTIWEIDSIILFHGLWHYENGFSCCHVHTICSVCIPFVILIFYVSRVMLSAAVCLCAMEILTYISGLVTYSYFAECDPLKHPDPAQRLNSPNQVLFYFAIFYWSEIYQEKRKKIGSNTFEEYKTTKLVELISCR